MAKHGVTISFPVFQVNSFDKLLLKRLLTLNNIVETDMVKYTISLEGKIAIYCRQQSYPIEDYINGVVLRKFSEEMDDYTDGLKYAFPPPLLVKLSKSFAADWLFVQMLGLIDVTRDVRLLTEIYFENGFPKDIKQIKPLIKKKLLATQRKELRTGYATTVNEVISTLSGYVEHQPSPFSSYGLGMTMLFLPFLNELDIIPIQHLEQLPDQNKLCIGQWLTFSEDVNLDEEKMTREDKDRVRECPMINNLGE